MPPETEMGGPVGDFPPTRWTLVLASRETPEARRRALEELMGSYWRPLYVFARRKGLNIESAKDAVQGFLAQLLDRDFLARLDPGKGSLRGYLKASIQHFLVNQHEGDAALKRGGGRAPVALDFDVAERHAGAAPAGPEDAFDREWAAGIMERSAARLRREFEEGGRKGPFELVLRFFGFGAAPSHADAAREHGMSVSQLKAFLHRARLRFRGIVREEVARTTAEPAEVDAEITRLLKALVP